MLRHLENVRRIEDLPTFFQALGYTPDHCPIGNSTYVIARWNAFLVVGAESQHPADTVAQICGQFRRSNMHVLAVGIQPGRQLVVAVSQTASTQRPRLFRVDLLNPTPDALMLLEKLRPGGARSTLQHALRLEQLLASETVSELFYNRFKSVHDRMLSTLPSTVPSPDGRMLVLLPLIRLLFLYFVQAKGWLAGQGDFIRNHFDQTLGERRHFQNTFLQVLFFETLNRPLRLRRSNPTFQAVPYLNGGLFDKHPVEKKWPSVVFDNDIWTQVFDDVFERFRFCVREAHEVDAIAPDMLGRVFERIMVPDLRHTTGSYYTPESIVSDIVSTALSHSIEHLADIDYETARLIIAGEKTVVPRAKLSDALNRVRVLDPAVGSGAFLLTALDLLTRARLSLLPEEPSPVVLLNTRRSVLGTNLFGVDLNPIAVRLAELRLWLAVIADDPTTDVHDIEPLPNLDGFVRQGDSLFDPIGDAHVACDLGRVSVHIARQVAKRRSTLFEARGPARSAAISNLRTAELRMAETTLQSTIRSTTGAMRDLMSEARGHDLFGRRTGFVAEKSKTYARLRSARKESRQALQAVREGSVPFFSYQVHAPEIMANGGFTTVVGNPPWVRAERLTEKTRHRLKVRFSWWRGSAGRGFRHLPDLSFAFTQRALELTRPGGTLGFLVPGKLLTAGYAQHIRDHLLREYSLEHIARLPNETAAQFGATTYPLVLVVKNKRPTPNHTVQVGITNRQRQAQTSFRANGPWILVSPAHRDAIADFMGSGTPLQRVARISLGVKTGANDVFIGERERVTEREVVLTLRDGPHTFPGKEVRPVIRGRDVHQFKIRPSKWIIWTHDKDGRPKERMSKRATRYFRTNRRRLEQRTDYVGGPVWTMYRTSATVSKHLVVWPDITNRPAAAVLAATIHPHAIPLNSCYVSAASSHDAALAIAAVINTTWVAAMVAHFGDEARGGYRRMNAHVAGQIPIPPRNNTWPELVEQSRSAHHAQQFNQTALDETVAKCFGLSTGTRRKLIDIAKHHC